MSIPPFTPPLMSISWGGLRLPDNDIAVYFAAVGEKFGDYTSEGFNAYVQGRFVAALNTISAVANVAFTVVTNAVGAEFKMVLDNNEFNNPQADGQMNPPGEPNAGVGELNLLAGNYAPGGTLENGGSTFLVLVHEFLHGMGLAHPHDDGGGSTIMAGVTASNGVLGDFYLNQGVFTVMSYNDGYHSGLPGSKLDENGLFGGTLGPSALDIAVLQSLYGANTTTGAGNSVYVMPEANASGTGWLAIWDIGGHDEIRYNGSGNTTIDLRAATLAQEAGGGGWVSSAVGIAGGFTIAYDVVIEDARGGSGNDTIIGNSAANTLLGNAGDDNLSGLGGNDTIRGGEGADTIYGSAGNNQLFGDNGNDQIFASAAGDFIGGGAGNDMIRGGDGADTIYGGLDNDNIGGGAGNDVIFGSAGANVIYGGLGNDTVQGGTGADTIYGSAGNNQLFGNDGNDVIYTSAAGDFVGGGAGNDSIFGSDGADTIYAGLGDDFIGGGAGNDMIFAGVGANRIYGGLGDDSITAGSGRDVMTGGAGADVFVFSSAAAIGIGAVRDVITDFTSGEDHIDLRALGDTFNNAAGLLGGGASSFYFYATGGLLIGDHNGDGAADWVLELTGTTAVTANDFLL